MITLKTWRDRKSVNAHERTHEARKENGECAGNSVMSPLVAGSNLTLVTTTAFQHKPKRTWSHVVNNVNVFTMNRDISNK
jgi:hypothetical protein